MFFWILLQLIIWAYLAFLSLDFQHYHFQTERPIILFVCLWAALFGVYILASHKMQAAKGGWKLIVFSGVLYRLILVPSNPIQEDDFYRYLWDGAVCAQGINPYLFSPDEILRIQEPGKNEEASLKLRALEEAGESVFNRSADDLVYDLHRLSSLADQIRLNELHYDDRWNPENDVYKQAIPVIERVNHPEAPTVYPPLAQAIFGLSATVQPGSLRTLRLLFVGIEVLTLFFILKALAYLGLSKSQVVWYAWNPLVIKEFINSPHLDVLMVLCAAGFMACWASRAPRRAVLWAGLGVLAKLLTGVFLPFVLLWRRQTFWALGVAGILIYIGFSLFSSAGERRWQSMKLMGNEFRMNSVTQDLVGLPASWALEKLGKDPYQTVQTFEPFYLFPIDETGAEQPLWKVVTRCLLLMLAGLWVLGMLWRARALKDPLDQLIHLSTVLLGLLVLSPVANPWYFGILMVFLPLRPRLSFLVIGTLMGLYYLRFYFIYHVDDSMASDYFHQVVVWQWWVIFAAMTVECWWSSR